MNEGLVDDYRIWVHPVVLGAGKPLFRDGQETSGLTLRDVRQTSNGVVILGWMRVVAHGIACMMDCPSAETFAIALRLRPPPGAGHGAIGEPVRLGCGWCHGHQEWLRDAGWVTYSGSEEPLRLQPPKLAFDLMLDGRSGPERDCRRVA